MARSSSFKREVDFQIMSDWIEPHSKVLDLGCGRGIFLENLIRAKQVYGVGVDSDPEKVLNCVKREVPVFQGDILSIMATYPENYFDWVVCSRTLHELPRPSQVISESLRVGKNLALGFANFSFWENRLSLLMKGQRVKNDVFPDDWANSRLMNPVSIGEFEAYCKKESIKINRKVYLSGDWQSHCKFMPKLFSGYALYDLSR